MWHPGHLSLHDHTGFYSNMHGFDYSVPHFVTRVQGTRIVVTPDIVFEVLHVPRVALTTLATII